VHAYYPASGQVYFERLLHASIFHDVARWEPHPLDVEGVVERTPSWTLVARRLEHAVETFGYRLQEADQRTMLPDKLAAAGVAGPQVRTLIADGRIAIGDRVVTLDDVSVPRPGQAVAFVMDTRMCAAAVELARGADLLVCESTYLSADAARAHENFHLTAAGAATIAREAGVRRLVLTHFSQRYPDVQPFVDEASAIFPDVVAAVDGQTIAVPKRQRPA
jgi:ribonuclease Z